MAKVNRILIVGLGSIGKRHLNNIQKLMPQASLAVLRSRPTNQSVAGCEMIASLKDAVEFRPDMALICNPSSFHLEVAKSLAAKCIHLFIEKPLSNQVRGVKELIEMIDRCELKAMVGYNLRFSPSLQAFKSLLDTGKYGRTKDAFGKHDYIGMLETMLDAMVANDAPTQLHNDMHKHGKNGSASSLCCGTRQRAVDQESGKGMALANQLITDSAWVVHEQDTFVNFMQGSCGINLMVAVDFTASNDNPNTSNSLHALQGNNQYKQAI